MIESLERKPGKILASLQRLRDENQKLKKVNKDLANKMDKMLNYIEAAEADMENLRKAVVVLQGIIDLNPNLDNNNEDASS
jgi:predicted  nucleic acid-binding Zn-ribbon protein